MKKVWRTAREEIPSWSTPTIFESNGRAELVTQATRFTRGYDPATGKELWRLSGNSEITIPTPIVGPGVVIVTNGGTGVSLRDNAYETIVSLLDKRLDGFGELFRMLSYAEIGAAAMLSRAVGGIAQGKVVFSLPGSTKAVKLGMEKLILPQAGHLYFELQKHAGRQT